MCKLEIKIVTENPDQFMKAHDADAGYDILSNEVVVIPAGGRHPVKTGLKVAIPYGFVGILKSRSGLASKHGIDQEAGVIDSGYTGEILCLLHNSSNVDYTVDIGDKVSQMVIVPIIDANIVEVRNLDDTTRGEDGFNSTGYKVGGTE